jgi:hypothetical protein
MQAGLKAWHCGPRLWQPTFHEANHFDLTTNPPTPSHQPLRTANTHTNTILYAAWSANKYLTTYLHDPRLGPWKRIFSLVANAGLQIIAIDSDTYIHY